MRAAVPWTLFAASLIVNVVFLSGVLTSGGRELARQAALELPQDDDVAAPLDLTEAQAADLEALRAAARERGARLREVSTALRQDLLSFLDKADFDRAALAARLHEASIQREDQFIELAELLHGYLQKLTPAQRAELLERSQDRGFLKALLFGSSGAGAEGAAPQKSSN